MIKVSKYEHEFMPCPLCGIDSNHCGYYEGGNYDEDDGYCGLLKEEHERLPAPK